MRLIPYTRKTETPALWDRSHFFEDFFNDFPFRFPVAREGSPTWNPPVDILEKNGNLILRVELPGVDEKEIDLKIEGNVLTLKGERKLENEEDRNNYHRMECYYGSFSRSFTLPETVDRDKIKADFKKGILTVTIPHRPEVKPREIPVNV